MIIVVEDIHSNIDYDSLRELNIKKFYTDPAFKLLANILRIIRHYGNTSSCRFNHVLYNAIFSDNLIAFMTKHFPRGYQIPPTQPLSHSPR